VAEQIPPVCQGFGLPAPGLGGSDDERLEIWDHSDRDALLTGAPCAQDAAESVAGSPAAATSGPCLAPMVSPRDLPQFRPDIERSREMAHAPVTIWVSNQATAIPLKP
jgi:hypothetical protein